MTTARVDALEVIYEDDDEGAVSSNESYEEDYEEDDHHTSLHGHPDHPHSGENEGNRLSQKKALQVLRTENKELRSHLTVLAREVERADTELVRWRARYRKIEDERDALKREFDRLSLANSQEHNSKDLSRPSQYTVAYSTPDADNSESSGFKRQQQSNNTEHITSLIVNNNLSQGSQQGIPVHRGRLRQQVVNPDSLDKSYDSISTESSQRFTGDFGNARLSARPLNSEALPFSPSWLGPKVPPKEGFINGKHANVIHHANHNGPPTTTSESLVDPNVISHSSNSLKPKDDSSLMPHEGHLVSSPGIVPTTSPGSTIISLSRQTSPSASSNVPPIQPPRQKSVDSLGRSASTASTLSNSSSHASSVCSSISPTSSQPYSPKKRMDALAKQPSLEALSSLILPDGFQDGGALVQTLRGRAKEILEGRASPGIVRTPERNPRSSDIPVSIHPVFTNGNTIRTMVDSVKDTVPLLSNLSAGGSDGSGVPWTEKIRLHPTIIDGSVDLNTEDKRTTKVSARNHDNNSNRRPTRNGFSHNAENLQGDPMNIPQSGVTNGLVSKPNESFPLDFEISSATATNAMFQEYVDVNHNNNLMADLFVQSLSENPYTNFNPRTMSANGEDGFMHPTAQLQFARALTPGSNLNSTTGFPVAVNGATLFNTLPILNGNVTSTHNGPVSHSQVSIPSSNALPMDVLSFPPDRIIPSPSRNVPSIPGLLSTNVRSSPFAQFPPVPVLQDDPDFGPVIVHGPLPPRYAHHSHGHGIHHSTPRRKREPASVPPRHLGLSTSIPATGVGVKKIGDFDGGHPANNFNGGGGNYGW